MLSTCQAPDKQPKNKENTSGKNLITGLETYTSDSLINVLVEIPAGTLDKYELNKKSGRLQQDSINGRPRVIQYLTYPGNYGMIPKTILPKESGGDGDPLDILVLGPAVKRGTIVKSKLIGVLRLLDRGEQDDKLIAVMENSPLYHVEDYQELNEKYHGVSEIIETWFTNYKGPEMVTSKGFASKEVAEKIMDKAVAAYKEQFTSN